MERLGIEMKVHNMARISQCMIVKNEEKNIERALSWGKGIVSEQIVVDTGSSDRTVEIAEQMGAKVYHFEWIDDFAAAKNFAISKAKYEWIALLDADEYFQQEDAQKLLYYVRKLQNKKYDMILTAWVQLDEEEKVKAVSTQSRVFRNTPGLRYKRRIHEFLASLDGYEYKYVDAVNELSIYHTGYTQEAQEKKKGSNRNLKLIEAELAENPDDWEMLGYLGDEHYNRLNLEEAEEAYRKAISCMPAKEKIIDPMRCSWNFVYLLDVLYLRVDTTEETFMEVYNKAIEYRPEEADFDYSAGEYFVFHHKFEKAEKHLKRALELLEKNGNRCMSMFLSGKIQKAYEMLAACCFNNKNLSDCVNYSITLLKTDKYLMSTLVVLLSAFRVDETTNGEKAADASTVAAFLGQNLYDLNSLKDRIFLLKAAMQAGYESLTQVLRGLFTPQELLYVEQALE